MDQKWILALNHLFVFKIMHGADKDAIILILEVVFLVKNLLNYYEIIFCFEKSIGSVQLLLVNLFC